MNIIIDENLHNNLQQYILDTITFGSHMKGENHEDSDLDLLHIIPCPKYLISCPLNIHHQLQFKEVREDGVQVDHIYTTVPQFVHALLYGDTTINYEILSYGAAEGTCLEYIQEMFYTGVFDNYTTYRAFLGIAKRDIKDSRAAGRAKDHLRCNRKWRFAMENINLVASRMEEEGVTLKNLTDERKILCLQDLLAGANCDLRNKLNERFQNGIIPRTVDKETFWDLSIFCEESIVQDNNLMYDCEEMLDYYYEAVANS